MPHPLDDLLDRTRDALLSGDLTTLAALEPEVLAQRDSLARLPQDVAVRLQRKAERNARLLQSAARGLRAARQRLAQINGGPTLATYDARGQKAALVQSTTPLLGRF